MDNMVFTSKQDESSAAAGLFVKARKQRRPRHKQQSPRDAKGAAEKSVGYDFSQAPVRLMGSDGDSSSNAPQDGRDDEIEVLETKGYKQYMRELAGGASASSSSTGGWYSPYEDLNTSSSDDSYHCCYECFNDIMFSNEHSHQYCKYHEMKGRKKSNPAKQFYSGQTMSENVDGYVGNKSMDFIMDFLGEKDNTSKKTKKKSKAAKKQQQQNGTAAKKQQKDGTPAAKKAEKGPTAEEQAAKNQQPLNEAAKPEKKQPAPKQTNKAKKQKKEGAGKAKKSVAAAKAGEKPKAAESTDKSWFAQVEEASDAEMSDRAPSVQTATESETASVASEPEQTTHRPPTERAYYSRVFVNSKLQTKKGYQR